MLLLTRASPITRGAGGGSPTTWTFTTSHPPYAGSSAPTQANMSDSNAATYYAANTAVTSWVKADFGANVTLSNVYLADAAGNNGWGATYLNGAVIAGSTDDSSYTTLATASGHTSNGAELTYAVSGSYRYVRVQKSSLWIALSQCRFD